MFLEPGANWLVSRHGLKIRVRGGSSLENSEAEILANGLVRLERRRKIKNVNEVTFLDLVCLTLLLKKRDGFAIEDSYVRDGGVSGWVKFGGDD